MPPTITQQNVIDTLCVAGRLYPEKGGFWTVADAHRNERGYPSWYVTKVTVTAMETRGWLQRCNVESESWKDARELTEVGKALQSKPQESEAMQFARSHYLLNGWPNLSIMTEKDAVVFRDMAYAQQPPPSVTHRDIKPENTYVIAPEVFVTLKPAARYTWQDPEDMPEDEREMFTRLLELPSEG